VGDSSGPTIGWRLRPIEERDRAAVLRLNEADVHHLSPLDDLRLAELIEDAHHAHVVVASAHAAHVAVDGTDGAHVVVASAHAAHVTVDNTDGTDADPVRGFVVTFAPGASYDSPNYRWFAARYERFLYLDRIVVAAEARRRGVARFVYDEAERAASELGGPLVCEVNVEPPNDASLAFHRARGYREVGRQAAYGKTVVLLESPASSG
jgi:uncharacterized protein